MKRVEGENILNCEIKKYKIQKQNNFKKAIITDMDFKVALIIGTILGGSIIVSSALISDNKAIALGCCLTLANMYIFSALTICEAKKLNKKNNEKLKTLRKLKKELKQKKADEKNLHSQLKSLIRH